MLQTASVLSRKHYEFRASAWWSWKYAPSLFCWNLIVLRVSQHSSVCCTAPFPILHLFSPFTCYSGAFLLSSVCKLSVAHLEFCCPFGVHLTWIVLSKEGKFPTAPNSIVISELDTSITFTRPSIALWVTWWCCFTSAAVSLARKSKPPSPMNSHQLFPEELLGFPKLPCIVHSTCESVWQELIPVVRLHPLSFGHDLTLICPGPNTSWLLTMFRSIQATNRGPLKDGEALLLCLERE